MARNNAISVVGVGGPTNALDVTYIARVRRRPC